MYIYVFPQNVLEELPKTISSIFQLEQEDVLEWGVSEAESTVFKSQETLEVRPVDESSKPLKDEQPTGDSKAAKWVSLKVKHYLYWKQLRLLGMWKCEEMDQARATAWRWVHPEKGPCICKLLIWEKGTSVC